MRAHWSWCRPPAALYKRKNGTAAMCDRAVLTGDLPARLGDTGQLATVRHLGETHTRNAVLRQHSARAAGNDVAAARAHRRSVAGRLLQRGAGGLAALVGTLR